MKEAVLYLTRQHVENRRRIWELSIAHAKKHTVRTSLGIWWVIIRDIVYIAVMACFRYLMSGGVDIQGMHFIVYLILGLIPWFFMNEVISGGVYALKMNTPIVKGISFPVSIIPTVETTSIFIKRIFTITFCFLIVAVFEDFSNFNFLILLYYCISMYILMVVYNFIFSAFATVSEDFLQLYTTVTRVLMFFLPILWSYNIIKSNNILVLLLKALPFSYIITGFRDAFIIGKMPSLLYSLYFWGIVIVMLILGSCIQYKFRKHYADFI